MTGDVFALDLWDLVCLWLAEKENDSKKDVDTCSKENSAYDK